MKRTMEFRKHLTGGADRVWATVAAVGGVDKWFPGILSCRVEGHGAGARRFCEMAGGAKLAETVIAIDEPARTFRYTVDEGLPVARYEGLLQVRAGHEGSGEVVWTVSFEGEPDQVAAMEAMLAQLAPAGLEGLANAGVAAA
jgi:hypothetical protein